MNILLRVVQKIYEIGHVMTQVLTLSDVVDEDPCTFERNMIIFVAHLCSALLNVNPEVYLSLTLFLFFCESSASTSKILHANRSVYYYFDLNFTDVHDKFTPMWL